MEESELGMETFRTMQEKHALPLPEYEYDAPYLMLTFSKSIEAFAKASNHKELQNLNKEELMGFEWIKGEVSI